MTRKALTTKWKVIICCIAIIIGMAGTGITVWAIARNYFNYTAGFEVNITGNRDVYASITGSSYVNGSNTASQTLNTITFNNSSASTTESTTFNAINMENNEKVSKFRFEITNNSPYTNHNDLILKASTGLGDIDDVIVTWYYSTNNTDYYVYTGEYLVAHKNNTLYLELRMLATQNMFGELKLENHIGIDLYSEINQPTDFELDYEYSYDRTTATKRKVCPTCDNCTHTYEAETMDENEYMFYYSSVDNYINETAKIENKVIFCDDTISQGFIFSFCGGLKNVVLYGIGGSSDYGTITFNISANTNSITEYNNITIMNWWSGGGIHVNITGNLNSTPNYLVQNIKFVKAYMYSPSITLTNETTTEISTIVDTLTIKNCTLMNGTRLSNASNIFLIGNACANNSIYFENIKNAVFSNNICRPYQAINGSGISGKFYIINNYDCEINFTSTLSNITLKIENNDYITSEHTPGTLVMISGAEKSSISVTNNYASNSGFDWNTYKLNYDETASNIRVEV